MCRRFISCDDFASLQQHTSQTNQLPLSPTLTLAPFSINSYSSCLSRFSTKSLSWTFSRTCPRSKYWKLFNTSRFLLKDPLKINRMLAKNRHTASDFLNAFVFYARISSHELSISVRHAKASLHSCGQQHRSLLLRWMLRFILFSTWGPPGYYVNDTSLNMILSSPDQFSGGSTSFHFVSRLRVKLSVGDNSFNWLYVFLHIRQRHFSDRVLKYVRRLNDINKWQSSKNWKENIWTNISYWLGRCWRPEVQKPPKI